MIAALLYNNLAMTSPYWCPPSRLCLLCVVLDISYTGTDWKQMQRNKSRGDIFLQNKVVFWCAILIAHQIVMAKHKLVPSPMPPLTPLHIATMPYGTEKQSRQNMEVPVSIFQKSPLAGEPRERLFHIHSVHRYQLCAKYLYPSTLLWQINCCNL